MFRLGGVVVLALGLTSCFMPVMGGTQAPGAHYVGILYETWFNSLQDDGRSPVPTYPDPANAAQRRYWGEPALGKYLSDDPAIYQQHADLLAAAGVDFLLVDYSNSNIWDEQLHLPLTTLLNTFVARLAAGKPTPKLVFLINGREEDLNKLDLEVYQPNHYRDDLFFYYEGKPLLCPLASVSFPVTAKYTVRPMWGLLYPGDNSWSFMEPYPQKVATRAGWAEEMPVAAAQQASYMSDQASARGRKWSYSSQRNDGDEGANFDTQWKLALMVKPKFVIVKSWNEWIAYGPYFTDELNREYSNDLEPMDGGHGDWYYQKLKGYVSTFKGSSF